MLFRSAKGIGKPVDLLTAPQIDATGLLQQRPTMVFNVQPVAGAMSYRAQIARDAEVIDVVQEEYFRQPRLKFDQLEDGNYFIRITAIDSAGLEGKPSVTAFRLKARPEPPFISEPKNKVRTDNVRFAWTEATQANAYRIQVASDPEFAQIVIDRSDLRENQIQADLQSGQRYHWRVASISEKHGVKDQGPYSDPQNFIKLPPQSPASFHDSEGKNITFSWPSEPGQHFLIQIAGNADFSQLYFSREQKEAELTLPRPPSGDYYIRVRATDADGYIGAFSAAQKIRIEARWTDSNGEAIRTTHSIVKTGY